MKPLYIIAALLIPFAVHSVQAQKETTTREPKWKQVSQAYGFFYAQNYSLDLIAREFPDLAPQVRQANFEFMSTALGGGASALESVLVREWPQDWAEAKPKITKQFEEIVANQAFTRDVAEAYIKEVNQRAKGVLPVAIRDAYLAYYPAYVKSPGAELSAGWRQNFSTIDHPKANGANISFGLPLSWSKREGTREGVVQVFRSGAGHGPILCTLMCERVLDPSEGDFSEADMKEVFTDSFIKESLPDGATFIEGRPMTIAGMPGVMSIFDIAQEELDIEMKMRFTSFVFAHKQHIIFINFQLMDKFLSGVTFDEAQKAYFPTYRTIMATLVRNQK